MLFGEKIVPLQSFFENILIRRRDMKFGYRQIWQITYPILFSLLMENMINLTDTIFLGHVGEVELGASALAGVYYLAIFMLAFGFSVGVQILIGRRNGEKRYEEIGSIFRQGTVFLLALAAVLFFVSQWATPVVLRLFIQSDAVYAATEQYMEWRVYGFFFSFVAVMYRAFFVGITRTRVLTINSIVMVLSNVVLNYMLIFGKCGFPELGIAGAAIASSVAEAVSVIFFMIYVHVKVDRVKYGFSLRGKFDFGLLRHILGISVWTMIQSFISISTWFLFFLAVEHLGERPLAITNMVRSISSLMFIVVNAFGSTTSSLVSNLMGAGQARYVLGTCGRTVRMCYAVVVPIMLLMMILPQTILRLYTDNVSLIEASVPALWVMVSSYLVNIPCFIIFNTVSGTGNTRSALAMELGALVVYALYVVWIILKLRVDVALCWTAEHVYAIVMMTLCWFYLKRGHWRSKRI